MSRIDEKLGPKLSPNDRYGIMVWSNFLKGYVFMCSFRGIDRTLEHARLYGGTRAWYIQGERRGRVRAAAGEWWLVSPRKR